jgi:hypothetical protein
LAAWQIVIWVSPRHATLALATGPVCGGLASRIGGIDFATLRRNPGRQTHVRLECFLENGSGSAGQGPKEATAGSAGRRWRGPGVFRPRAMMRRIWPWLGRERGLESCSAQLQTLQRGGSECILSACHQLYLHAASLVASVSLGYSPHARCQNFSCPERGGATHPLWYGLDVLGAI